jgi:hypothetical protein
VVFGSNGGREEAERDSPGGVRRETSRRRMTGVISGLWLEYEGCSFLLLISFV